jgi:hypothetical protein
MKQIIENEVKISNVELKVVFTIDGNESEKTEDIAKRAIVAVFKDLDMDVHIT